MSKWMVVERIGPDQAAFSLSSIVSSLLPRKRFVRAVYVNVSPLLLLSCTIAHIGPPEATLTKTFRVRAQDVQVFKAATDVKGHYSVVDNIWVKDDGDTLPRVSEQQLCGMAGARGANAIILDPLNRRLNGVRIDLKPTLDEPFEYFSATAIWIGEGRRPERTIKRHGTN